MTVTKRQREQKLRERKQLKAERRARRKEDSSTDGLSAGPPIGPPEIQPDSDQPAVDLTQEAENRAPSPETASPPNDI